MGSCKKCTNRKICKKCWKREKQTTTSEPRNDVIILWITVVMVTVILFANIMSVRNRAEETRDRVIDLWQDSLPSIYMRLTSMETNLTASSEWMKRIIDLEAAVNYMNSTEYIRKMMNEYYTLMWK